jgi:hypothetical protein
MRYGDKLSRYTNEGTVFGKESTILAKVNASSDSVPTLKCVRPRPPRGIA